MTKMSVLHGYISARMAEGEARPVAVFLSNKPVFEKFNRAHHYSIRQRISTACACRNVRGEISS